MNILLIGYGKMGKAIERIATDRGHTIVAKPDTYQDLLKVDQKADVAIEFTQPDAVVKNLHYCFERQLPVVSGTTGWLQHRAKVEKCCTDHRASFFYASNYSLGVNLFFELNQRLAKMISQHDAYRVDIQETHHVQKLDAPSGTAITLADGIVANHPKYSGWELDGKHPSENIPIKANREEAVPGTHVVSYHSEMDTIQIKHTAHKRDGFALGAVCVAEWMPGRTGIFSMKDFLSFE